MRRIPILKPIVVALVALTLFSRSNAASFIRGNADGAGAVSLSDARFVLDWLYAGGSAPECMDAADANDDGQVDISDGISLIETLFLGRPVSAPYPTCGDDPTSDALGCFAGEQAECARSSTGGTRDVGAAISNSRGSWRFEIDELSVDSNEESGDEPYLVMIGFSSKFGVRDSTRTYRNEFTHEYWSDLMSPEVVAVPPEMGVVDFGEVDDGRLGIAGVIAIAMESDATSWGALEDLFDDVEYETRVAIRRLVESETLSLANTAQLQGQINTAIGNISSALTPTVWEALDLFVWSFGDIDEMVGVDRRIWVLGLEQDAGEAELLGEREYAFGQNALTFDGSGVPAELYGGGEYSASARLTSTVLRVGDLEKPRSHRTYWESVPLEVSFCPGCHPVTHVKYWANYDRGDGLGRQTYILDFGDPGQGYAASWDVTSVPPQEGVEVWAEFVSNSLGGSVESLRHVIDVRVDREAPYGRVVAPETKSAHGLSMRLVAEVGDLHSSVDRVEFEVQTAQGVVTIPSQRITANEFATDWNCSAIPEQTVMVGGTVYDTVGLSRALSSVTEVHIDHTPPTVASIYPSPDPLQMTWIVGESALRVSAEAEDESGIADVHFTAYLVDPSGNQITEPVGATPRIDSLGEYSVTWDVTGIADHVDNGSPHRTYIDVTAVDTAGNEAFATGWIAGFDREPPEVRITAPFAGQTVAGDFPVVVGAGDNLGINGAVEELTVTAVYQPMFSQQGSSGLVEWTMASVTGTTGWSGSFPGASVREQMMTITAEVADAAGHRSSYSTNVFIDRTPPSLVAFGHAADPFYAGGGRSTSISYQVSERASVAIAIRSATGTVVRQLRIADITTAPQVASWDGLDDKGRVVSSGQYSYDFTLTDSAGNSASTPGSGFAVVVDTTPPALQLAVSPNPFSLSDPKLEIQYAHDESARAELEVLDGAQVIRYLGAWQRAAGTHGEYWDGTDFLGRPVAAPRIYTVRLRATDAAGNESVVTRSLDVRP